MEQQLQFSDSANSGAIGNSKANCQQKVPQQYFLVLLVRLKPNQHQLVLPATQ